MDRTLTKQDEGRNSFVEKMDFNCEDASNFSAEMQASNIHGGGRVHKSYRVERTTRDIDNASLISPPSGSKSEQSMVLSKATREQRMELSVRTAIKFYFVQDMLGFDQPSEAVEWLIEKSEAAIRQLPEPSSISPSQISQYVVSNRAAVSSSCIETGDLNSSSEDDTFTVNDNRQRNLDEQTLAARSCTGQKSSTAPKKTKSNNNDSTGQGEKREQRSMAMRSVASKRRIREIAKRCRQRTKPKDKIYNKKSIISQKSSMRPPYTTFCCLQENTTPPSSMMNETMDANSSSNAFLHGLMLPRDSTPCNQTRRCISSPPAEIECSSHPSAHDSARPQQE